MTGVKTEQENASSVEHRSTDPVETGHSKRIWLAGFVVIAMIFLFMLSFVGEQRETAPGAISPPKAQLLPGQRARGLLKSMDLATLEQKRAQQTLFYEANGFLTSGNYADAYIAYFALARQGHGGAAMKLGEMSDPQTAPQFTEVTGGSDYVQAVKWYQVAVKAGVPEAKEKLAELLETLRSATRKGDLAAQRVLLEIE